MDKWLQKKPFFGDESSLRSSPSASERGEKPRPSLTSPKGNRKQLTQHNSHNGETITRFFNKKHTPASESANDIMSPVRLDYDDAANVGKPESPPEKRVGNKKHRPALELADDHMSPLRLDYDVDAANIGKSESPPKKRVGESASQPPPEKKMKTNQDCKKKKKKSKSIPDQDYPDPLSGLSDHWVTERQFLREKAGGVYGLLDNIEPLEVPPRPDLNIDQRQVVGASPATPLSVRAGAGTGKTSTMVERAVNLVTQYGLQADGILMVTFSNKAAAELRERVRPAFRGISTHLPTTKTFHGLAYNWIRIYYKAAGFSRQPTILATTKQRITVMELAIKATIDKLRLEICCRNLNLAENSTWGDVLHSYRERFSEDFAIIKKSTFSVAKKDVHKNRKESSDGIKEDIDNMAILLLRFECYLRLIKVERPTASEKPDDGKKKKKKKKAKDDALCPIERRFSAPEDLIKLLDDSRTNKHELEEYLPFDAMACRMYEQFQLETCQVDFDSLLAIFATTLMSNTAVVRRFRDKYRYTIVDEYQDNSEAQADLLRKIVDGGSCTVVGDDDQTIYGFRGASPGNFDRLKNWYSEEKNIALHEATLTENYRSSANILAVATKFLERSRDRHPKQLNPTKEAGHPVELWHCKDKEGQSRRIVSSIIERHESGGICYGEMAILLRCSKMGPLGSLSTAFQEELFMRRIPFVLVGSTSLFERETVLDLLAYLRLALGEDDDAMKRVINKPPRKLPADAVIPLIEQHRESSGRRGTLQQAAKAMCKTGASLSASRHSALRRFMSDLEELGSLVNKISLPCLIDHIWKAQNAEGRSLQDFHENKSKTKETSGGKDDKKKPNFTNFCPTEVRVFSKLAQRHVDEWIEREGRISTYKGDCRGPKTLVERAREVVSANLNDLDLGELPDYILTEVVLAPLGLGKPVVAEFLANAALEKTSAGDEQDREGASGKVCISTIHRAKGLEWQDVYVPFFNQDFMPTLYRPSRGNERHQQGCNARDGGLCNKKCSDFYSKKDQDRFGFTPQERHLSEERRLAHVAATRAKERLVFTCIKTHNRFDLDDPKQSEFLAEIKSLVVEKAC